MQLTVKERVRVYWEVTKPRIWYLLVFTSLISTFIASKINSEEVSWFTYLLVFLAVTTGSASANTLTSYIDRDIDAIMERTKHRPIPSGKLSPKNALYYGLILLILSLLFSYLINIYTFSLMAFGLFDNIIVYSKWLKRRSSSNIILGGFSGGMPALIGYTAVTTSNIHVGLILAGLVFLWTPTHIWSLALRAKEDYIKAKVPMLPVVTSEKTAIRIISISTILMVLFSILPVTFGYFKLLYLTVASIAGATIIAMSVRIVIKPSMNGFWQLFKFSSPYLAILFIAMALDLLLINNPLF